MCKESCVFCCSKWGCVLGTDVRSLNELSLKPRTKLWGEGGSTGKAGLKAGLRKLQGSTRSQKAKPERDKVILIDAFHVKQVQVHSGWTFEFPVFKTFLGWSWNCTLTHQQGGLCVSGIIRHMRPSPRAKVHRNPGAGNPKVSSLGRPESSVLVCRLCGGVGELHPLGLRARAAQQEATQRHL